VPVLSVDALTIENNIANRNSNRAKSSIQHDCYSDENVNMKNLNKNE
jgi:hypothetical protein